MFLSMALLLVPNTVAESGLTGGMKTIHLNMKEDSDLSPETWGDNTRAAINENPITSNYSLLCNSIISVICFATAVL